MENNHILINGDEEFKNFMEKYSNIESEYLINFLEIINVFHIKEIDLSYITAHKLRIFYPGKIKQLPNKLSELIVSIDTNTIDFDNLPDINFLEIEESYKKEFGDINNLPNSIETLVIPSNYDKCLLNLPNSIKNCIFKKKKRYSYDRINVINMITPLVIANLPDSIEYLKLEEEIHTNEKIHKFPQNLTKLSINPTYFSEDYSILQNYSNITYLSLSNTILLMANNFINSISHLKKLKKLILNIATTNSSEENQYLVDNLSESVEYIEFYYQNSKFYNKSTNTKIDFTKLINLSYLKINTCYDEIELTNISTGIKTLILIGDQIKYFDLNEYKKLELLEISSSGSFEKIYTQTDKLDGLKYLSLSLCEHKNISTHLSFIPENIIYLDIRDFIDDISFSIDLSSLINLEYLKLWLNASKPIDFSSCKKLVGLSLFVNLLNPIELFFPSQLEILILQIQLRDNFCFNNKNIDKDNLFSNILFPEIRVFGFDCLIKKHASDSYEITNTKLIEVSESIKSNVLKKIPDSIEALGFNDNGYPNPIPLTKFPKNIKSLYMLHIASSLGNYFENQYIFETVDNKIEEHRFEAKHGNPISHMENEYFYKQVENYHKSSGTYEEILNI